MNKPDLWLIKHEIDSMPIIPVRDYYETFATEKPEDPYTVQHLAWDVLCNAANSLDIPNAGMMVFAEKYILARLCQVKKDPGLTKKLSLDLSRLQAFAGSDPESFLNELETRWPASFKADDIRNAVNICFKDLGIDAASAAQAR